MRISFSENLKMMRNEKGISQKQLAEITGVSQQCVSKWEAGHADPTLSCLWKLADFFGVSIDVLCGRVEW